MSNEMIVHIPQGAIVQVSTVPLGGYFFVGESWEDMRLATLYLRVANRSTEEDTVAVVHVATGGYYDMDATSWVCPCTVVMHCTPQSRDYAIHEGE